jgi:diacylglycerol kinase (ATP)
MKLIKSFGYAYQGIITAAREQLNIKIHLLAIIVVVAAGCYYGITPSEWGLIVLCFGMVLSAELFNSALENLVDLVSPGHHHIAGKVKDMAAGAVLVTAMAAITIAIIVFKKYII